MTMWLWDLSHQHNHQDLWASSGAFIQQTKICLTTFPKVISLKKIVPLSQEILTILLSTFSILSHGILITNIYIYIYASSHSTRAKGSKVTYKTPFLLSRGATANVQFCLTPNFLFIVIQWCHVSNSLRGPVMIKNIKQNKDPKPKIEA